MFFAATFKSVHLRRVFDSVGDLLALLISLDELLRRSPIASNLAAYRRMLQTLRPEPEKGVEVREDELGAARCGLLRVRWPRWPRLAPSARRSRRHGQTVDLTLRMARRLSVGLKRYLWTVLNKI